MPPDIGVDSTTSAPDGSYRFGPLVPGSYQVDVTPPTGYLPAGPTTRIADLLDGDTSGVDFTVAAAIFRAGGKVTAGGDGVAGVEVNCYAADQSLVGTGRTDSSGNYLCPLLSPGDYQVDAIPPPGYVRVPDSAVDFTVVDADVSGLDFMLVPGYPVTGLVVDAQGIPLPDVPVDLVDPSGRIFSFATEPDGRYSSPDVVAGAYTIVVRPPGGAEIRVPITVPVAGGEVPTIVVTTAGDDEQQCGGNPYPHIDCGPSNNIVDSHNHHNHSHHNHGQDHHSCDDDALADVPTADLPIAAADGERAGGDRLARR